MGASVIEVPETREHRDEVWESKDTTLGSKRFIADGAVRERRAEAHYFSRWTDASKVSSWPTVAGQVACARARSESSEAPKSRRCSRTTRSAHSFDLLCRDHGFALARWALLECRNPTSIHLSLHANGTPAAAVWADLKSELRRIVAAANSCAEESAADSLFPIRPAQ